MVHGHQALHRSTGLWTLTPATIRERTVWLDRPRVLRHIIAAVCFATAAAPQASQAAACDEWRRPTVRVTGSYVPAEEAYARPFVFAMLLDCHGTKELVTVQRSTGNLPVCGAQQQVEVVGELIWNKALVDGHYEINSPSSVTCSPLPSNARDPADRRQETPTGPEPAQMPAASAPPASSPALATPRAESSSPSQVARGTGTRVWVGRYRDSRGEGDVTFSLVQGESTVSGTWKVRTGGGGPLTGVAEAGSRRFRLRMENTAPACPGTFEGWVEIDTAVLVGAYRGTDCDGPVSNGRLELHPR
jgi:hypothetical protein